MACVSGKIEFRNNFNQPYFSRTIANCFDVSEHFEYENMMQFECGIKLRNRLDLVNFFRMPIF
jgi:hypothetical protein